MGLDQLTLRSAQAIKDAFEQYHNEFKVITRRCKTRFEQCDWAGIQHDAVERLDLYKLVIDKLITDLHTILGADTINTDCWKLLKKRYSELIANRSDFELAETFFNSVTRKTFTIVGVNVEIEYIDSDFEELPSQSDRPIYRRYQVSGDMLSSLKQLLQDCDFRAPFSNLDNDCQLVLERVKNALEPLGLWSKVNAIDIFKSIFYRNKAAYVIGRLCAGEAYIPFIIPLLNTEQGISIDTVLLTQNEVSIIFSFTRSYFHVEADYPHELISFLKSIMPLKPIAELYTAIGYNKHGKTELYRNLLRYLAKSDDQFEIAPGKKGMVMIVFTLPSYDVVFKIIKDKPAYPKTSTRQDVIDKYDLVYKHDRAGRLVDAQEFEHLKFDRSRFSDDLIEEFEIHAKNTVTITEDSVIIKHLYTERKLVPLNIYVKEASLQAATDAIIDYGNAIKDIVTANIFPGDILLKNFGVTRHGRVVFYDYDEICPLTECNFRNIPPARNYMDELEAEPWFSVGENDVFPEEFKSFLELEGELRQNFLNHHDDLFAAGFWQQTQKRLLAGEIIDVFPYRQSIRFNLASSTSES